ncbi:NINE protein [Kiloniella litopenaei]|uniref:NINE protein n=1 Tax=Kiloniella litopenaei TaxID=1549748 RepID=UPI0009E303C1
MAYLLWLFTGIFGGHRWYLGKRWSALAMSVGGVYFALPTATFLYGKEPIHAIYTDILFEFLNRPQ